MALATLGRAGFEDSTIPVAGKSEWGMDTLMRRMTGYIGNLEAYLATLSQGLTYNFLGTLFYLQSWQPDDSTPVATVQLNYKGLRGGTPVPDVQREIVAAKGNISRDYTEENDGKGRPYRKEVLWRFQYVTPSGAEFDDEQIGERDVYAAGATMEFTYKAVETRYRYVRVGEPSGPRYHTVGINYTQTIEDARITTSDGAVFGYDRALFFNLVPVQIQRDVGFTSHHVIGSPFWECEDSVRLELGLNYDDNIFVAEEE